MGEPLLSKKICDALCCYKLISRNQHVCKIKFSSAVRSVNASRILNSCRKQKLARISHHRHVLSKKNWLVEIALERHAKKCVERFFCEQLKKESRPIQRLTHQPKMRNWQIDKLLFVYFLHASTGLPSCSLNSLARANTKQIKVFIKRLTRMISLIISQIVGHMWVHCIKVPTTQT